MIKRIIYLFILLLTLNIVSAAVIHGNIYDINLDKQSDAIVTIDTIPKQTHVTENSSYLFEVQPGTYTLKAAYYVIDELKSSVIETISIQDQGTYRLDLILFPSLSEEEELLNDTENIEITDPYPENKIDYFEITIIILSIAAIILIILLILRYRRVLNKVTKEVEKTSKELSEIESADEADKIFEFIKSQGGRTTQKDIRNNFPSSEAKISLIITELEDKGLIKKIKRGRGNIIILKK